MLEEFDASAVRRWCSAAVDALAARQREIDELNVYPVPDGDTGTNLLFTLRAAAEELRSSPAATAGSALRAMSHGAVLGARGNSGVIVSQILGGMAAALSGVDAADGMALALALGQADDAAWAAVDVPVEGTALSVMRAAARGADTFAQADLASVVRAAGQAAAEALRRTPEQLPALARAGVVDAGGYGVVVLIDALASVVMGESSTALLDAPARGPVPRATRESGSTDYAYEVQYLLLASDMDVDKLRGELSALGDSVAVVGTGDGRWNVHAHVNDIGAAIEAGVDAGRPSRITVMRFADQMDHPALPPGGGQGVAVVAVAPGEGLSDLYEAEGVVVVDAGPGRSPSTAEVLAAIQRTGMTRVILLPNHANVTAVADQAARHARAEGQEVAVVPTRSPVQGLAAVAVHDVARRFEDDVIAMAEAAAATRWAEVTVAAREAMTTVGRCQAGDVLGIVEGEVVLIGGSVPQVARDLADRLLVTGGELLTVILGSDADPGLGEHLRRHVITLHPALEVAVYEGGQPLYPLMLGVE